MSVINFFNKGKPESLRVLISLRHKDKPLDFFEKVLGKSSYSYNVGDLYKQIDTKTIKRKSTLWSLIEQSDKLDDIHNLIDKLFDQARPLEKEILSFGDIVKPKFNIWHRRSDQDESWFGFAFTTEQIDFLSTIKAEVDIVSE